MYDAGPKTVRCPIVFLPPASGTADIFFKQLLALSSAGYRVMSVSKIMMIMILSLNVSVNIHYDTLNQLAPYDAIYNIIFFYIFNIIYQLTLTSFF